ncbi:MAG: hypothetical protein ABWW69_06245 [Pyrodictiaceae archaeon]
MASGYSRAKLLALIMIASSYYYFWRAVELTASSKPLFLSSMIALLIGIILLSLGVKLYLKQLSNYGS